MFRVFRPDVEDWPAVERLLQHIQGIPGIPVDFDTVRFKELLKLSWSVPDIHVWACSFDGEILTLGVTQFNPFLVWDNGQYKKANTLFVKGWFNKNSVPQSRQAVKILHEVVLEFARFHQCVSIQGSCPPGVKVKALERAYGVKTTAILVSKEVR